MIMDNFKPSKFSKILFENNISLKEVADGTKLSYPVLLDLKSGKRSKYRIVTLQAIVSYFNEKYNLNLKIDDIAEV